MDADTSFPTADSATDDCAEEDAGLSTDDSAIAVECAAMEVVATGTDAPTAGTTIEAESVAVLFLLGARFFFGICTAEEVSTALDCSVY